MNQFQLVLVITTVFTVSEFADPPGGFYKTKYDTLDVEDVLNHKRLVHHYGACLLHRGPCPPQGADLKRILPEALQTNCLRCTEKQKEVILRTIRRLRDEYTHIWREVADLYDPSGEYVRRFEATFGERVPVDQQVNLLANKFSENDEENNIIPPATLPPYSLIYTNPKIPSTTKISVQTHSTIVTDKPSTIKINIPSQSAIVSDKPSTTTTRPYISTSIVTRRPLFHIWNFQNIPNYDNQRRPFVVQKQFFKPFVHVDGGLLGSISEIGNQVIRAGTKVAGMVISAITGNN